MIKLSKDLSLPDAVLAQHVAVLGKTRSGKSSVMRLLVERLLDDKKPVCVIDPKGDWWGLRSSASGKTAGYPVRIFGGEHADLPLSVHAGSHVAQLIADANRSCIIDLGGWMVGDRTRFFIDFASTLFRHIAGARYLVIDEVHNFAPQGKVLDPDAGKMLHWANRLASEGAGKGLTLVFASQRPQKVHKDFLTCAETLVAMRVIHPLDRGAVKEWIDGCADPTVGKTVLGSLADMQRGEAWVWSPEARFGPDRVQFPLFSTYDSFSPKAHGGTHNPKGWASVDLDVERARLEAITQEAKANDPALLKARIRELEAAAKKIVAPSAAKTVVDQAAIDRAVKDRDRHWKGEVDKLQRALREREGRLAKINQQSHLNGDAVVEVREPEPVHRPVHRTSEIRQAVARPTRAAPAVRVDGITTAQQRVLNALAWWESIGVDEPTVEQVAFVARINPKGGHFSNTVGPLSTSGMIDRTAGTMRLTDQGRQNAAQPDRAPTMDEYHAGIRQILKSGAQVRILDALIEVGGDTTTDEIGAVTGIDPAGGHFSNSIGPLGTLGLIERRAGVVRPTSLLFPPGL